MSDKKTLQQIIHEISVLETTLFENDGELEQADYDSLTILQEELEEKLRAYSYRIKVLQGSRTANIDSVKSIQRKSKSIDNIVDKLKSKMVEAVLAFGSINPKTNNKFIKYSDISFFTKITQALSGNMEQLIADIDEVFMEIKETPLQYQTIESIIPLIDEKLHITYSYLQTSETIEEDNMDKVKENVTEYIKMLLSLVHITFSMTVDMTEIIYKENSLITDLMTTDLHVEHNIGINTTDIKEFILTYGNYIPYIFIQKNTSLIEK